MQSIDIYTKCTGPSSWYIFTYGLQFIDIYTKCTEYMMYVSTDCSVLST